MQAPASIVCWPAEAIWQAVAPGWPGFTVEVLPEIDSTNTELMRRARAGRLDPVLLVAERQTAGRGRLGRAWASGTDGLVGSGASTGGATDSRADALPAASPAYPPTAPEPGPASLTFSIGLPLAPSDWSGLSLVVGLVVAESLHPALRLKWPNDLWWRDRKLGGILVETASQGADRQVVVGVGLNIAPRDGQGLSTPPAALRELWPEADAPTALARVVPPLMAALRRFEREGFAPFQARFAACDALAGRAVRLSDGTEGRADGVAPDGALLVHTSGGMKRVTSSEVSVRPADHRPA